MSRSGDEMINNLVKLLDVDLVKTAAKKEDKKEEKEEKKEEKDEKKEEKKCEKCGKEKCECKEEKKEDKKEEKKEDKKEDKKKKKSEVLFGVINELVKLANELDEAEAVEASNLIDDALQAIVKNLEK